MNEAPAKTPFDQLEIPEQWKDEPRVKLGAKGREYAIAPMSGRNISEFTAAAVALKTGAAQLAQGDVSHNIRDLYVVVHFGLKRAYPDLSFDDFYDSDARPDQLQDAFQTVATAAGLTLRVVPAGEAQAAPSLDEKPSMDGTTS